MPLMTTTSCPALCGSASTKHSQHAHGAVLLLVCTSLCALSCCRQVYRDCSWYQGGPGYCAQDLGLQPGEPSWCHGY